jgi:hypothetical protein
MTWGRQNSETDAHAQLSYALEERGINFIDTAGARTRGALAHTHVNGCSPATLRLRPRA